MTLLVREDFRRDGLAANFHADDALVSLGARCLPGSVMNIGYPAICTGEYSICDKILKNCASDLVELSVVGHARRNQMDTLAELVNKYPKNTSANIWMPVSKHFLDNTVRVSQEEAFAGLKQLITYWQSISKRPLDVALADCTSPEPGLISHIENVTNYVLNSGARRVILCDSRGIATPNQIRNIFEPLARYSPRVEFHPHNDNNFGQEKIREAIDQGVKYIGTAFYQSGERLSMVDPRELTIFGLHVDANAISAFDQAYKSQIGDPDLVLPQVYGKNIIVTGSQWRLRSRNKSMKTKFGVTTDTFIASQMLDRQVTDNELANLKDTLLYNTKNICFTKEELKGALKL